MRPSSDTLLVWTGAPCSYGCSACPIDPGSAPAGVQAADLLQGLTRLPAGGGRLAVLVGGEPFLRTDFLRLIAAIRAAGCAPGLITTGRPLVYPQLREKLHRANLAYLRIQLFGSGAAHDRAAAVPGAFEQALAGMRAWVAEDTSGCDVDVALSTRGRPMATVFSEIGELARAVPSASVQIVIALDAAGRSELERNESLRATLAGFATWNDDVARPVLAWEGLPGTLSAGRALTIAPLRAAFVAGTPRACCLGDVDELAAITAAPAQETRANSFNFVRTATSVPWAASAAECTAYAATDVEPARQVWLHEGEHLALYTTDTGDFPPDEIAHIKTDLSHLFVDRAAPGVLDDFTEGMRRVLPDPTCDACSHRARCGHRFRVVEGPPFAREEAWIATHVAGLRGRVLDVGCGEQLYRDQLAPLLRSGAVRYTGLDPDRVSLERIRTALPEGRFFLAGIEDFRGEPASYDHILCLRSLNHVVDLDDALGRMAELLKPGGSLLIVETTPFAMLRRPEQVAAADHAPRAGHQHFRNLASDEVLPFARRRALQVVEHHAASLHDSNEWFLLLERARSTSPA